MLRILLVFLALICTVSSLKANPSNNRYLVTTDSPEKLTQALKMLGDSWEDSNQFSAYDAVDTFGITLSDEELRALQESFPEIEFHPVRLMKANSYEQSFPTWGLDRLDQTDLPLDRKFKYPEHAGKGVNVYIIDTGIAPHAQFENRLQPGFNAMNDKEGTNDCVGHGTHVAGIVAAKSYGVAKKANLYPVRVLNCRGEGTDETVIAGVNWVAKNAKKPAVANLSLGGEASAPLDAAMAKLVKAGVVTAVAAGNESDDACGVSPARAPSVITVGATTKRDTLAGFSNYGKCIDILAPGEGILSTYLNEKTTYLSGTSMASPFVAGVLALASAEMACPSPGMVEESVKQRATWNKINNLEETTVNLLLHVWE